MEKRCNLCWEVVNSYTAVVKRGKIVYVACKKCLDKMAKSLKNIPKQGKKKESDDDRKIYYY
jgi:hypothetical protein